MTLPDVKIATCYPTIGPQGAHVMDVNGAAVSIELFLGHHNLIDSNGVLTPVVWSNYVSGVKRYQGAIEQKTGVLKRFISELDSDVGNGNSLSRYPELAKLWETIFARLRS